MEIVFGAVLLILAAAVVVLFAMFGELASRVGDRPQAQRWQGLRPLEDARLGAAPDAWPTELAHVPSTEHAIVLALSTSCGSCSDVARQVAGSPTAGLSVALACPTTQAGRAFVEEYGIGNVPHFFDVAGSWLRSEFDVQTSPSGLVFSNGRLVAASVLADLKSLATAS